jgi:hypothetical protein
MLLPDLSRWDPRGWLDELRARISRAAVFAAIAGLPVGLYELFLRVWFHGLPSATGQLTAPLAGRAIVSGHASDLAIDIVCVVVPALICTGMGLWALKRGLWRLEVFALLITIQLSVTFAASDFWIHAIGGLMRLSIAVVLLALFCVPIFDRLIEGKRWWLWASSACWLLLVPPMFAVFGVGRLF